MKIKNLLSDYFCDKYKIDTNKDYEIEQVNARDLIVPGRIDLIAKLKFVEFVDKGYSLTYASELYKKHLEAFTLGTYSEQGNKDKNTFEHYFEIFKKLIIDIKTNGVDETISVIPVGRNNEIMDGAHRTAIAAYFNQNVPIVRLEDLKANNNTDFFRNRFLEEQYLDYLVTEYCKLKENVYILILWPRAKGKFNEVEEIINKMFKVIYKKGNIKLNYNGLRNFIVQVYATHEWLGSLKKHFAGATPQVNGCYDEDGDITAYVLESDSLDKVLNIKEKIRNIYNVGNYSVHSTDNKEETIKMANILFNKNTLEFLNEAQPDCYVKFNEKVERFKKKIIDKKMNLDNFIIDSSSTLALYGLRDIEDIDFMSIEPNYVIIEDHDTENHHEYIQYYETSIDEMILNPRNYLYYNDVKFITIELLKKFKRNRNEEKDLFDLKLISSIKSEKTSFSLKWNKMKLFTKRRVSFIKFNVRKNIVEILKKLGLYNIVKKIRNIVRGLRSNG